MRRHIKVRDQHQPATETKPYLQGLRPIFMNTARRDSKASFISSSSSNGPECPPEQTDDDLSLDSIRTILDNESLCERLSTLLEPVSSCCAGQDDQFYGSIFIENWFLSFTESKESVIFATIFKDLRQGLEEEGRTDSKDEQQMTEIVKKLDACQSASTGMKDKKRIKMLQECCLTLYTEANYIHRVVNKALRENDGSKLNTLGPYCYLLFNYIGYHQNNRLSVNWRAQRAFSLLRSPPIRLYRGDFLSDHLLEQFQKAVSNNSNDFKMRSFVSTSTSRRVAECFANGLLYDMQVKYHSAEDQCINLTPFTHNPDEREILLRPGVRFRVREIESVTSKSNYSVLIKINILPSFISRLNSSVVLV